MLKAIVVSALGGVMSGHFVRNGWKAMFLVVALIGAEATYEVIHHHWSGRRDIGVFGLLDTIGSGAVLVGEALSV
ncbi:MAG TPA: hypothetical protein VNX29_03080 [Kaistia sp.]|nr:hypothetical protein [Kaistia sp.]